MYTVIELLNDKNIHLEKFYRLNEAELEKMAAGDFSNLEYFYGSRDGLLDLIKKIDELIERNNEASAADEAISDEARKAVLTALEYKTVLVNNILEQDLQILSFIESEKSNIIKELTQVRAARKAIGSYHSGQKDTTVDEEA